MSFREYLNSHYEVACNLQREIVIDTQMVEMLHQGVPSPSFVKTWMKNYNLFRGISNPDRDKIVASFLGFARSHSKTRHAPGAKEIEELFTELFTALYRKVPRSWMSATSKLLWGLYPDDIVMYDKFVYGTLTVMQCIDKDLAGFPRIGASPRIDKEDDISAATNFYMNYLAMVRKLQSEYADELSNLRRLNNESYPYDIRIVDKLLWMIGNPKTKMKVVETRKVSTKWTWQS